MYIPPPGNEDVWRLIIVFLACGIATGVFFMGRKCMCGRVTEPFDATAPAPSGSAPAPASAAGSVKDPKATPPAGKDAAEPPLLIPEISPLSLINANLTDINKNIAQLSKDLHQMLVDQHTQQAKQDAQEAARAQQNQSA
jgi:hypothetical protein